MLNSAWRTCRAGRKLLGGEGGNFYLDGLVHEFAGASEVFLREEEDVCLVVDLLGEGRGGIARRGGGIAEAVEDAVGSVEDEVGVFGLGDDVAEFVEGDVGDGGELLGDGRDNARRELLLAGAKAGLEDVRVDEGGQPGLGVAEVVSALAKGAMGVEEEPIDDLVVGVGKLLEWHGADDGVQIGERQELGDFLGGFI